MPTFVKAILALILAVIALAFAFLQYASYSEFSRIEMGAENGEDKEMYKNEASRAQSWALYCAFASAFFFTMAFYLCRNRFAEYHRAERENREKDSDEKEKKF